MNRFVPVLGAVVLASTGLWPSVCGLAADEPKPDVKERTTLPRKYSLGVWSVAFSPDGKTLAAGSKGTTITLWDVATGKKRANLEGHTSSLRCVAFSPDGKTLVSADVAGTIKLWDVKPTK